MYFNLLIFIREDGAEKKLKYIYNNECSLSFMYRMNDSYLRKFPKPGYFYKCKQGTCTMHVLTTRRRIIRNGF